MTETRWSLQAVERAAPDAASLAAGRKLAQPGPWSEAGATDTLVWGRCQGSGKTPYQVSVDLTGPAYRCSCPSRKFPCKHAIALLLRWAGGADLAGDGDGTPADFAQAWAEQRAGRAAQAAQDAAAPKKPADPEARAKRLEERLALMDGGIDDFALWLTDLVRGGLVDARRRPYGWWDAAAARLVDAQVPGLAERVRDAAGTIQQGQDGDDWSDQLLDEIGRWWTAVRAWQRRTDLDPRTHADLRAYLGWAVPSEEVRAADSVTDVWQVLGAHRSDDGRLQQQRTWLRSLGSGETVLVLDFAGPGAALPAPRLVGAVLEATLARYPGSAPRRARFVGEPVVGGTDVPLPAGLGLDAARETLSQLWQANPWAHRAPVVLAGAVIDVAAYLVHDTAGRSVPLLAGDDVWTIAAVSGGRPTTMFGELEAAGFRPLTLDLDATPGEGEGR